jgi:hypothetical protein
MQEFGNAIEESNFASGTSTRAPNGMLSAPNGGAERPSRSPERPFFCAEQLFSSTERLSWHAEVREVFGPLNKEISDDDPSDQKAIHRRV